VTRRGFALVAVLWVIAGLSVLGLAVAMSARDAIAAARNRVALTRAAWIAEGCGERARAEVDRALANGIAWERLGSQAGLSELRELGCTVRLTPAGHALDVNQAGAERLTRLFAAAALPSMQVDSLVHALLDWRDEDDVTLPLGAEAAWYRARGRVLPRNGPYADPAELRLVRGFAESGMPDSLLGTEPGRTPVNLAPLPVVASLPGMTTEVIEALRDRRQRGVPITDLVQLSERVSTMARDTLLARFGELVESATIAPDAWVLDVTARAGSPSVEASLQLRLAPGARRAVVVRKKTW
jgi:type II secretory pathway component PulK